MVRAIQPVRNPPDYPESIREERTFMGLTAGFVIMMLAAIGAGDGLKAGEHRDDPSHRDRQERQIEKRSNDRNVEYTVPVEGVVPRSLVDTWGAVRSEGRSHEGIDIFAKRNTPVSHRSTDGSSVRGSASVAATSSGSSAMTDGDTTTPISKGFRSIRPASA